MDLTKGMTQSERALLVAIGYHLLFLNADPRLRDCIAKLEMEDTPRPNVTSNMPLNIFPSETET